MLERETEKQKQHERNAQLLIALFIGVMAGVLVMTLVMEEYTDKLVAERVEQEVQQVLASTGVSASETTRAVTTDTNSTNETSEAKFPDQTTSERLDEDSGGTEKEDVIQTITEQEEQIEINVLKDIKMYAENNTESKEVESLSEGEKLTVLGEPGNGWLKVKHNDVEGYIYYLYTDIAERRGEVPCEYIKKYTDAVGTIVGNEVELTELPGYGREVLAKLNDDDKIQILFYCEIVKDEREGWYKVVTEDSQEGYVYGEYVYVDVAQSVIESKKKEDNEETEKATENKSTEAATTRSTEIEKENKTTEKATENKSTEVATTRSTEIEKENKTTEKATENKSTEATTAKSTEVEKDTKTTENATENKTTEATTAKSTEVEKDTKTTENVTDNKSTDNKATTTQVKTVTTEREVVMYKETKTSSDIIVTLNPGTKLTDVKEVGRGWLKASYGSKEGYVYYLYTDYAEKAGKEIVVKQRNDEPKDAVVNGDFVNLRQYPGITTQVKDCLRKGTKLKVISFGLLVEGEAKGWFLVENTETKETGYMYGQYVYLGTSLPKNQNLENSNDVVSNNNYNKEGTTNSNNETSNDESEYGSAVEEYQAYAKKICQEYDWSEEQYKDLVKLWNKESGWNPKACNKSSGAYGIPQALPASKMKSYGDIDSYKTQIEWGVCIY